MSKPRKTTELRLRLAKDDPELHIYMLRQAAVNGRTYPKQALIMLRFAASQMMPTKETAQNG